MAKTKTEKIADIQAQIEQLKNQEKRLMQQQKEQERKDRTKRLCKRMGLFESMLPETISLTDEQFKIFLKEPSSPNTAAIYLPKSKRGISILSYQNPRKRRRATAGSVSRTRATEQGRAANGSCPQTRRAHLYTT